MRKMLLTTAMIAALGCGAAYAQTTTNDGAYGADITAPEGFERDETALTAEDLLHATVYDARGDAVGEIEDLVLATVSTGEAAGATTGQTDAAADTTVGTADATGDAAGTDGNAAAQDTTGTGTATTDTTTDATGTDTADDTAATDGSTTGTTTGTTDNTDATANDTAGSTATDTTGDATGGTPTGTANDARMGEGVEGEVTHAVIDVGGFLGIGERRVALPIADLVVYRSDVEMRVYLPWTEEQLEQLPVYNVNDPATLGTSRRTITTN